jgi:hypothetical protein
MSAIEQPTALQFPALQPPRRYLFGPGPSMVHPRVYDALSKPIVGHLDPYFIQVMGDVQQLLKTAYGTRDGATLVISGTGSAGMEAAVANFVEPEGGWPRLLTSLASPTQRVPRPSRTLRRAGVGNARASGWITPHDPETKFPSSLDLLAPARLRPKGRNDNCSTATPRAHRPSLASPDCDACTAASPRASSLSTR